MKTRLWQVALFLCIGLLPAALVGQIRESGDRLALRVDEYVRPLVRGKNFSGSILIARGGKVLLSKGYGMANYELSVPNAPHTRFHIASVSKSFTAAAILMLEERGRLSVHDPLSKFLPDYPHGDKVTIHDLLAHRSGIPSANDLPEYQEKSRSQLSLPEIIAMFKDKPLQFEPGSRYRYSNSNYNLLAYIIEKVSGKTYGEFLQENIFKPLQMDDTGNDDGSAKLLPERASGYVPVGMREIENAPYLNWSIKTGNGSLYSSVKDFYKWDRALYTDAILSKNERQKMFTDYGGFGYGWAVSKHFGRRVTLINGRSPGFTASLERFIDDDVCIAIAANTYSGITQSLADDLAAIVLGEKHEPPLRAVAVPSAVLQRYVGRYRFGTDFVYNPNSVVTVELQGDALVMQTASGPSYLIPLSDARFVDRLFGGGVTFTMTPEGGASALNWSFGKQFAARKID